MKLRILICAALTMVAAGCSQGGKEAVPSAAAAPQKKKPGVKVITVAPQPIVVSIKTGGTVESKMQTTINAPAEGMVESLKADEGDMVGAGTVLGYVVSTDQQNMLALSRSDYEKERTDAGGAEDAEQVASARKRLDMAKDLFKPFPIVSPAQGVVLVKYVEAGATVNARQPVMLIADLRQIIVKTAVAERHVGRLRTGMKVKLTVPALGDSAVTGAISMIYPAVDARTRTSGIEISVPRHRLIRPGMTAVCEIVVASKAATVALPHDAVVVKPNGDKIVFTVRDSTAYASTVVTGLESNTLVEIVSGVLPGDVVAVAGNENLKDGAAVKVSKPEQEKSAQTKSPGDKKSGS